MYICFYIITDLILMYNLFHASGLSFSHLIDRGGAGGIHRAGYVYSIWTKPKSKSEMS